MIRTPGKFSHTKRIETLFQAGEQTDVLVDAAAHAAIHLRLRLLLQGLRHVAVSWHEIACVILARGCAPLNARLELLHLLVDGILRMLQWRLAVLNATLQRILGETT